jgi:uncharacterized protein (DUF488 family)
MPTPASAASQSTVYTVGHSTRTADELIELLRGHGVALLIDVRRFPGSRRHPQFNREALALTLEDAGISYLHVEALGGRRDGRVDSPNAAWRNAGFRAYADYMGTPEFGAALDGVVEAAGRHTVALMCAEAVPWRCHRNLVSDALTARGVSVHHILGAGEPALHRLHPAAHVDAAGVVTYQAGPPPQQELFE